MSDLASVSEAAWETAKDIGIAKVPWLFLSFAFTCLLLVSLVIAEFCSSFVLIHGINGVQMWISEAMQQGSNLLLQGYLLGAGLAVMLFVAFNLANRNPNIELCDENTFQRSHCLGGKELQDWSHSLCFQRWLLPFGVQLLDAKFADHLFVSTEQSESHRISARMQSMLAQYKHSPFY